MDRSKGFRKWMMQRRKNWCGGGQDGGEIGCAFLLRSAKLLSHTTSNVNIV